MKIAYTTTFDMQSPSSWPKRHLGLYGAGAKIVRVLENEETTVEYLGALTKKRSPITRLKWMFYRNAFKQDFYSWADPIVGQGYARQIEQKLSESDADILLCPENAIPLANVRPDRPMVLWTDATLGSLVDFYPYLSNLCGETRRNLMRMEKRVLDRCSLLIVNSEWAAQRANELYDIPLSKVEVIPRGANKIHDLLADELAQIIHERSSQVCQLLFVAVDWVRKGGDTALGVARSLNQSGIPTELHVVGCPPPTGSPDFVIGHGFIDRTTETGQAEMDKLFRRSHFLMYPTKADALGMALSEAAAFGVPALASRIGGIPGLVKSGVTGETFPVDADWKEYCQFVIPYIKEPGKYKDLAMSTFRSYRNHMSWPAVGERARNIFKELLN
ncbi:MAG: glycosyltransferase family 4 protein [Cyanobacteria bacterium P01_D01_bin.105]